MTTFCAQFEDWSVISHSKKLEWLKNIEKKCPIWQQIDLHQNLVGYNLIHTTSFH